VFKTFSITRLGFQIALAVLLGAAKVCAGADLVNNFVDRQVVTDNIGSVLGSNIAADLETNEPRHGGKPGGHSVWISFTPRANGIVTIDTKGSSFDTLLGVYTLGTDTNKVPMDLLKPVAGNDDDDGNDFSFVQFGVSAGTTYQIAVDGYEGAQGDIQLNWALIPLTLPPPIIVSIPGDQSIQPGDTVTLAVNLQSAGDIKFRWRWNNEDLPPNVVDPESSTLVITNFQDFDVGVYKLSIRSQGIWFDCQPVELQLNSEGATNALARDKLLDAPGSELKGSDGSGHTSMRVASVGGGGIKPRIGVIRGYDGTQVFNTTFATVDPAEPQHCGVVSGGSYWLGYQPPANGVARLDTEGSSFDTVLAVYSYLPPLLGYQQLVPINCDDNSGTNGATSKLQFVADPLKSYLVVVAGVNAARGIVHLHYSLATNQPPREVNLAPSLLTIQPCTVNPLSLLTVTNTASEPNVNATTSGYFLLAPPDGASIDGNGVITWTPTFLQSPSTNVITTVAVNTDPLDLVTPHLYATNSFIVVVNEMNLAPTLPAIGTIRVSEGSGLFVTNSATITNPHSTLVYTLLSPPAGLVIDPNGVISWIPTEAQGPGSYVITTVATSLDPLDPVNPQLSATNGFIIAVDEVNSAPTLLLPPGQTVNELSTLKVRVGAADSDFPANPLTFALLSAPSGMTINSTTGQIRWTPTATQGPSTNIIEVSVSDVNPAAINSTSLSATGSFTVIVTEPVVSQPLVITSSIVGASLSLSWNTSPGKNYRIQYTEDAKASVWLDLTGNIIASGASLSSNVPMIGGNRFYRVVMTP
jgi:hypothetical protein